MSAFINTGTRRRLYNDAQIHDEWATTRLWEYIMQHYFHEDEFVVSSQQPPYVGFPTPLRRVDLIVEHISSTTGDSYTILMMEAKKHGATETDILECETQAWEAAYSYSIRQPEIRFVWFVTVVGTTYRVWIMDPRVNRDHPVAVLPGVHALGHLDEYLDLEPWGRNLAQMLRFIRSNHTPPKEYVDQNKTPSPASSNQEMSSPPPIPEAAAAAAKAPIPLSEEFWIQVVITHRSAGRLVGRLNNGAELESSEEDWTPRYRSDYSVCYTYMEQTSQNVYWTPTLEPFESHEPLPQQNVVEEEQLYTEVSQTGPGQDQSLYTSGLPGSSGQVQNEVRVATSSRKNEKRLREVQVKVIKKTWGKDIWQFEDARRLIQEPERTQWKRQVIPGIGRFWAYEGNSHTYYTRQKLSNPSG